MTSGPAATPATPDGRGWSLARRLSLRLAAQAVLGSTLVSALVYGLAAWHIDARQDRQLANRQTAIQHLLDEARHDGDFDNLRHRLDDYFASPGDLALQLDLESVRGQPFTPLYRSPHPLAPEHARLAHFEVTGLPDTRGLAHAWLWLDLRPDDQLLHHLATSLLAGALLGSLAISLAGWLQVRRGLAPLAQLAGQIRSLAANNLDQRLDSSAMPLELHPLLDQFNSLLARIDAAYRQLEGFNADVAHELNTPLATLITSTELALRKERDVQMLRDMLGDHLEDLRRLSGIVRDMLFLAQADRGAQARRSRVASIAAVAADVLDYHEAMLLEADLRAAVVGDAQGEFDLPLLKRALSNLLGNATRYARPGSVVRVEIEAGPGSLSLCVANQGAPIDAQHLPRLFDRFYRADIARAGADAHHGLGLSIVAAIARMHGGEPFASSEDGLTRIGLRLPV
jgi:two-component system heavy metal sensor histidine kinase CusS